MRFGPTPLEQCTGAILAHALDAGGRRLKKGRVLSAEDVALLRAQGVTQVVAARLEPGDVPEDAAAGRIAAALAGEGVARAEPFTGRANLLAAADGVLSLPVALIDALNRLDEGLTLATLPPWQRAQEGRIVATVKIIPFALPETVVARAETLVREAGRRIGVAAFRPRRAALLLTTLPHLKPALLEATREITAARLSGIGATLAGVTQVGHEVAPLAGALARAVREDCDLLLVAGASAIVDRRDVIPAAIEAAGGTVTHFGMPVDPGNLLLLGRLGEADVVGLPGCARSPKLNGIDRVLERLAAGLDLSGEEIAAMGVGGLLKEMPARPQPRRPRRPRRSGFSAAAIVLAAGLSRRMGRTNKLLLPVDGAPMIARVVDRALESRARPVIVVLGHEAEAVRAALGNRPVTFAHNPDPARGLASSLATGLGALPAEVDAVMILLGDMPRLRGATLDALIAAAEAGDDATVALPVHAGKRGNPVIWRRRHFPALAALDGDRGARPLLDRLGEDLVEVAVDDPGVLLDVDTAEAAESLQRDDEPR